MRQEILVLSLLLPLAGCLGGADDVCGVTMANPTGGSHFLYDAEGRIRTLTVDDIGEWHPSVGAPKGGRYGGTLDLPEGSRVELAISQNSQERLSFNGTMQDAHQITYWAKHPDVQPPLAWEDEWITPDLGQVIQSTMRVMRVEESYTEHFTDFNEYNQPGLLFSSVLWGQSIRVGNHDALHTEFHPRPHEPATWNGSLAWRAVETRETVEGCEADLELEFIIPGYPTDYNGTMTIRDGLAVPTALEVYSENEPDEPRYSMELQSHSIGTGQALSTLEDRTAPLNMPTGAPVDLAFPPGRQIGYDTTLSQAVVFARQQDDVAEWLEAHPDAKLSSVMRLEGAPGAKVLDGWIFLWHDGQERSRWAYVTNHSGTLPIVEKDGLQYESMSVAENYWAVLPPNLGKPWISWADLTDAYENHYGFAPEMIECETQAWTEHTGAVCSVGTIEGTGRFYAGEIPGGLFRPGLYMSPDEGAFYQDNSYDPESMGPPVPHSLL